MNNFLMYAVIGIVLMAFSFVGTRRERRRRWALKALAQRLGYSLSSRADLRALPDYDRFALFSVGHSRVVADRFYDGDDGCQAMVFRYRYSEGYENPSTGSGRVTTTAQTVVMMRNARATARFELCPEKLLHRFTTALGFQDIDFDAYPGFSKQYLLRGDQEDTIRAAFSDKVLKYLEQHGGLSVESSGEYLIVYCKGGDLDPDCIEGFLKQALDVRELFMSDEALVEQAVARAKALEKAGQQERANQAGEPGWELPKPPDWNGCACIEVRDMTESERHTARELQHKATSRSGRFFSTFGIEGTLGVLVGLALLVLAVSAASLEDFSSMDGGLVWGVFLGLGAVAGHLFLVWRVATLRTGWAWVGAAFPAMALAGGMSGNPGLIMLGGGLGSFIGLAFLLLTISRWHSAAPAFRRLAIDLRRGKVQVHEGKLPEATAKALFAYAGYSIGTRPSVDGVHRYDLMQMSDVVIAINSVPAERWINMSGIA